MAGVGEDTSVGYHTLPKTNKPRVSGPARFNRSPRPLRGHSRTHSNASSASRQSLSNSEPFGSHEHEDRASTPTNYVVHSGNVSTRSIVSPSGLSHGTHEENLSEIIVPAEMGKNEKLLCPLCGGVFRDPYIATCGHTFCRPCLLSGKSELCPMDSQQLSMVVRNLAVSDQVGELLIHCRYGCRPVQNFPGLYEFDPTGCPMIIKLALRQEHETKCEYAPVPCPNSSLCPFVLAKDLEEHMKRCKHVRCPHARYNCPFEGTKDELAAHLDSCKFEGLKGFLTRTDEHIVELEADLKRKEEEVIFLRSMLASLSEKVEILEKNALGKIGELEERQNKMQREVVDARHGVTFVMNELQHVQVQLGVAGTMDSQHLFKCKGTFVGHSGPVWALCISGDMLFSASSDNTIKIWDTTSFKCLQTLTGHAGMVLALCAQGNNTLISGSADHCIKIWNLDTCEVMSTLVAHDNPVCTLTLKGERLFSGSLKSIKVWNVRTTQLICELPMQNHWVRALSTSDKFLYSGSYQAVKVWNLDTLDCIHVLQCQKGGSIYSLAVTNQHIICGTYENQIYVWDVQSLQLLTELSGHVGIIYSLQVIEAPGQTRLFSACYDKTLRVWNMEHMTCVQTLVRHDSSVTSLVISRGRLFSGSVDSTIKVWQ
eukprot:Em0020g1004a